jgi:hypothetical protein
MIRLQTLATAVMCGSLAWSAMTRADAVTDWNEITMTAVTASRPGPQGMLDVALVHIAVHDAVQAIEKRFEPYHFELPGAKGSRSAAAAAAAYTVLSGIYPTQATTLSATYHTYLADKGLTGDPGLIVGEKAAQSLLPLRRATPNPAPSPFVGGEQIGMWRPTDSFIGAPPAPAPFSPMVTPWLADVDPFTLTSPRRFRVEAPPALTSERYRRDYEEVKAFGADASTARTPLQTDLAYFYNDNFFAQWNRVLRDVATRHVHRIGDSARMFALANMAGADALVTNWESKRHYVFWRPLTAIRDGDNDGHPLTMGDPTWRPMVNTPNYPDYPSGANALVGAMTRTLALFFGTDEVRFEVTSLHPMATQKTRVYERFSDASRDVVDVRVLQGIHFRFTDTAARRQGMRVAEHVVDHFLEPCTR